MGPDISSGPKRRTAWLWLAAAAACAALAAADAKHLGRAAVAIRMPPIEAIGIGVLAALFISQGLRRGVRVPHRALWFAASGIALVALTANFGALAPVPETAARGGLELAGCLACIAAYRGAPKGAGQRHKQK